MLAANLGNTSDLSAMAATRARSIDDSPCTPTSVTPHSDSHHQRVVQVLALDVSAFLTDIGLTSC